MPLLAQAAPGRIVREVEAGVAVTPVEDNVKKVSKSANSSER